MRLFSSLTSWCSTSKGNKSAMVIILFYCSQRSESSCQIRLRVHCDLGHHQVVVGDPLNLQSVAAQQVYSVLDGKSQASDLQSQLWNHSLEGFQRPVPTRRSYMVTFVSFSFNTLDLPEYPTKDILEKKLLTAIFEGNDNFGIMWV